MIVVIDRRDFVGILMSICSADYPSIYSDRKKILTVIEIFKKSLLFKTLPELKKKKKEKKESF